MDNMRDDSVAAIFVGAICIMFVACLFGYKLGKSNSYDNCIEYYSDLSVVDARITCRKIVVEGKK
jgi:hypothetical protein